MFINFFRARRARRGHNALLADSLSRRLEEEQTLAVDDSLISALGADKSGFFHTVYSMLLQERIHMMSGPDGSVRLMTNGEFHRFMLRQSRREGIPALADTLVEHTASVMEPDGLGWFALDVSSEEDTDTLVDAEKRGKLPDARQTLPERRREPWTANEAAAGETAVHF